MRKFLSVLAILALMFCFGGVALATTPLPAEDTGKFFYKGQEVDGSSLTIEEVEEYLGYKAARENAAAMAAMDISASALAIPNVENIYGDIIDKAVKRDRSDFLGDLAVAIMEQGEGGSTYQDPAQYAPYDGCVALIEYFAERAEELGFNKDQIVRVMAPNYIVPPHMRSPRLPGQTDLEYWDGPSMRPFYMYVELGDPSLPEVTLNVSHIDTWEDTNAARGGRGGWNEEGVYATPIHITRPNRFWTLGGSHQANVIRDPVTMRWVMIGRASEDNKGPAVAMLYALKAIKDSGIPLRRRIRCIFGTTEDATTLFRPIQTNMGRPLFQTYVANFADMAWYTQQDEMPVVSVTADSGESIVYSETINNAHTTVNLSWTNNPADIGLRFPNALDYRHEYYGGSVISAANQWGTGGGTFPNFIDNPPTALPAILYNQARESFVYKAYYAGAWSATNMGQSLRLVAWLVPPDGAPASVVTDLVNAANALKDSYRINWGGWEYPDEKNERPAVQKVALAGRWDAGIDVMRVDTATGQTMTTGGNAVQIITTGHVTRFWEREYFSTRHIMVDFLSKIILPAGYNAGWKNEMRKLATFYPFDNYRERKIWNGSTMVGGYLGKRISNGVLTYYNAFTPRFNTPAPVLPELTAKTTGAVITRANQGRNDENIDALSVTINVSFIAIPDPIPNDPEAFFNGIRHGTLMAPAIRLHADDLGLNVTVNNSSNVSVTGMHYTTPDSDVLLKAIKTYNNYYKRFGVPAPGYTGEIRDDKPDVMNGGTYARSFKLPAYNADVATLDGRMIAIGNWGGRGTLHGYNERVELDGMVDFVKRCARVFTEYAAGVPHKWEVTGNGNTATPHKKRLAYAVSNDNVPGIYIQEESEVNPIIVKLYSTNVLPRDEETEILFARKFRMDGLIGATPAMTLTTTLTNADGTDRNSGKIYMIAREAGSGSNVNATWNVVATGTAGAAQFAFAPGSVYNQLSSSNDVEVSVIAIAVTDGQSNPFYFDGEETDAIRDYDKSDNGGCNSVFAAIALLLIPFAVRRRK